MLSSSRAYLGQLLTWWEVNAIPPTYADGGGGMFSLSSSSSDKSPRGLKGVSMAIVT